jgi:hypothetical protein
MDNSYIGNWVVEDVDVDYDTVLKDIDAIFMQPSEYTFSIKEALDRAVELFGHTHEINMNLLAMHTMSVY